LNSSKAARALRFAGDLFRSAKGATPRRHTYQELPKAWRRGSRSVLRELLKSLSRAILIAALLWIAILICGSLLPLNAKRALHTLNTSRISARASWNHRAVHFLGFGGAAFLLTLAVRTSRERLLAIAAVIAIGVSLEFVQYRLGRTPFELWDVRDDAIAAVLAAAAAMLGTHSNGGQDQVGSAPAAPRRNLP
jgi:hypothetical protein